MQFLASLPLPGNTLCEDRSLCLCPACCPSATKSAGAVHHVAFDAWYCPESLALSRSLVCQCAVFSPVNGEKRQLLEKT